MDVLIGIDIGTTSCKAAAYDRTGNLIAGASRPTVTHFEGDGSYFTAEELWSSTVEILKEVTVRLKDGYHTVAALAVTGMGEAGVPLGASGDPVYPVLTWFDPRPLEQARTMDRTMREKYGGDALFRFTGMDSNPIFSLPKLLWIRDTDPDAFARTKRWICVPNYIAYLLCGEAAVDYSSASRTLLFDVHALSWSRDILDTFNIPPGILPPLISSGGILGRVTSAAARATGLAEGTPVAAGGHDHFCGSFSAGLLLGAGVFDSIGTAESVHGLIEDSDELFRAFTGYRIGRYVDPSKLYIVGGMVSSGVCVDWALRTFVSDKGYRIFDELFGSPAIVGKTPPPPLFLPHLRGSGAPRWDRASRGSFVGLTDQTTPEDFVYSVLEGLSFEFRVILEDLMSRLASPIKTVIVTGGGAKNRYWLQVKSDVCGLPLEVSAGEETAALGAALLAGVGIEMYPSMVEASREVYRIQHRVEPRPEHKDLYDRRFKVYRRFAGDIEELNRRLGGINAGPYRV